MRSTFLISVAFILVAPTTAQAQRFDTMYNGTPLFTGIQLFTWTPRMPLLVGPGGNHALPCSLFGSRTMRRVPTPYCLSDVELAEERERVRSIIGDRAPAPAVALNRKAMVAPPAGRRVVPTPLRPGTRRLFRLEPAASRRVAGRSAGSTPTVRAGAATASAAHPGTRSSARAYRARPPASSGMRGGAPAPRPAVADTPDGPAKERAQRIP